MTLDSLNVDGTVSCDQLTERVAGHFLLAGDVTVAPTGLRARTYDTTTYFSTPEIDNNRNLLVCQRPEQPDDFWWFRQRGDSDTQTNDQSVGFASHRDAESSADRFVGQGVLSQVHSADTEPQSGVTLTPWNARQSPYAPRPRHRGPGLESQQALSNGTELITNATAGGGDAVTGNDANGDDTVNATVGGRGSPVARRQRPRTLPPRR